MPATNTAITTRLERCAFIIAVALGRYHVRLLERTGLPHYLFASSMYLRRKLTTSGEVCEARWNSRSPASPTSKRG